MNPNNNDKPNFLDRGTIIAFLVIMVFWFAWSKYMETKYPAKPAVATQGEAAPQVADTASPAQPTASANAPGASEGQATAPSTETFADYSDSKWSFRVSSKGMGLRDIDIKGYQTRTNEPIVLGNVQSNYPFATSLVGSDQPIDFAVERVGEDTFVGRASVDGLQIEKTMKIDSSNYTISTDVKVQGAGAGFKGLETYLSDGVQETQQSGLFSGHSSYDRQDWYVAHEGTKTRSVIVKDKGVAVAEKNVEVLALSSHYFALAIVDRSNLLPRFESNVAPQSAEATGRLVYQPVNANDGFSIQYTGFAGPKSLSTLTSIDERLGHIIDYGMFAIIAHPLLWLLRFLHSIIGNWGWAIIGLTVIVRLIVMPFNIYSFRSMKVMQKVQPEMNRIREKYKDKPAEQRLQMNQEIMELMKRNKANPLGGCLPMLLQLPVFFALYQVLGQSIELYRAPFIFWIHDLSMRDPFYVLPVLMGITMFIQQKITPTTMDPAQAKILMWMPVIFSFFMLTLPSGLTLYIFVSTLFGITQQYMFMRDRTPATTVKEAKA